MLMKSNWKKDDSNKILLITNLKNIKSWSVPLQNASPHYLFGLRPPTTILLLGIYLRLIIQIQ
jgi:hypothetical protein